MITKRFEEQVKRSPGRLAVKVSGREYTYEGLNRYANRVGRMVEGIGGGLGEVVRVGLLFRHGVDMMAAILGVLKAGMVYVPLSSDYPVGRLGYMVGDSGCMVVLTEEGLEGMAREVVGVSGVMVKVVREEGQGYGEGDLGIEVAGDHLAYIMYTSGSTGRPKGVMQTHENVLYYTDNWIRLFSLVEGDRMTLFSSFCHDGSVQDMFGGLLSGAVLYPLNIRDRQGMGELVGFLKEEGITVWHSVPSLYVYFLNIVEGGEEFPGLRFFLLGGEPVRQYEIERTKELFPGAVLVNVYGQTESSVNAVRFYYPGEEVGYLTLGELLDRTELLVIDEEGVEVEAYEVGEIMVGCRYLSPGYWKNEEATRQVFRDDEEYGRLYFTGDLGRLLPGGGIEFMGRRDYQVKVRGFRIELGEIESQLLRYPGVREVVVTARELGGGEKVLCCYYMLDRGVEELPGVGELRRFLEGELPDYMVPLYFMEMEQFPLTQSGKIDRGGLPVPVVEVGQGYVAAGTEVEKVLVRLWGEVLKLEEGEIGIDDHFFQLGGHSLRAAALVSMIHQELQVRMPVTQVFRTPTVRGLGRVVEGAVKEMVQVIEKVPEQGYYPLSSAQKRLYILQQLDETGVGYNLPGVFWLEGELDLGKLEGSIRGLIRRHESLRTVFELRGEEPVQRVLAEVDFVIEYWDNSEGEVEGEREYIRGFIRRFDLSRAPLLRVGVMRRGGRDHLLVVDMHHIISDGISMTIWVKELMGLYEGRELGELGIQYRDYSVWQVQGAGQVVQRSQGEYWLGVFGGEVPVLNLPYDFVRPLQQRFEGERLGFVLEERVVRQLKALAISGDVTLYIVMLALYNVWLSRLSGQEDIVVGTAVSGRYHEEVQGVMGMFVNTLALWNRPVGGQTFAGFLEEVKQTTLAAFENQEYLFEDLVEAVKVRRDMSRNPLFDVMFRMQNFGVDIEEFEGFAEREGLRIRYYPFDNRVSKFDMSLAGVESGGRLYFKVEYSTNLFKGETIERWVGYLKNLVESALARPGGKLSQLEMMGEEEKRAIVEGFNNTLHDFPMEKRLEGFFREQAGKWGERTAVVMDGVSGCEGKMTYRELDQVSQVMGWLLKERGVGRGSLVGVMMERSLAMMVGIMGILRAGGAYLPIAVDSPGERVRYLIKDSGVKVVVVDREVRSKWESKFSVLGEANEGVVLIDGCWPVDEGEGNEKREFYKEVDNVSAGDVAYVIYTSGSTGKPKGVMVEHGSVINRLNWMQRFYPLGWDDVILQKTTIVFDVSVWELFWWMWGGASLCLLGSGEEKNPEGIMAAVGRNSITTMHFVPSMLGVFLQSLELRMARGESCNISSLRRLFASGEALAVEQVRLFNRLLAGGELEKRVRLINLYGPTEATVDVSYYECPGGSLEQVRSIPIGKPVDNIQLYVLNQGMSIQPVGIAGELFISGVGVARGYLNRPGLTAEKFVYRGEDMGWAGRWRPVFYRTGDLCRWLSDGNIEFLGRLDFQVKIRGYRIELGEIESVLAGFPGVRAAVVIVRDDRGPDPYLCAYVVSDRGEDETGIKEYLGKLLPGYMVPGNVIFLGEMPLTVSGKVDRKGLPAPGRGMGRMVQAPVDEVEKCLVDIWGSVLGIEAGMIGCDDHFFELGGHSLKAALMVARVYQEFRVRISLAVVFKEPTVERLARWIKQQLKQVSGEEGFIGVSEKKEYYGLTSAQKRLFILNRIEEAGINYNLPMVFQVSGGVSQESVAWSLQQLVERHEVLRTGFMMVEDEPVQRVFDRVEFVMEVRESAGYSEASVREVIRSFVRPFQLSQSPLFRAMWLESGEAGVFLVMDMHHIIADGLSLQVFLRELVQLCRQQSLPGLRVQYKDYAEWQRSQAWEVKKQRESEYWLKEMGGELPVLNLPYDFPRPGVQSFAGKRERFVIGFEETGALWQRAQQEEITLFMMMLGALNILLFKLSGQEDIIIGTAVAGRGYNELQGVMGMFVNTLPLRQYPVKNKRVQVFLQEIKSITLGAFENQEYAFEELVERVVVNRDMGRNPVFDVMMAYLPFEKEQIAGVREVLIPYRGYENLTSKFDLTLQVSEIEGVDSHGVMGRQLIGNFEYCTALFRGETVQRFIGYFQKILQVMVREPGIELGEIDILPEVEKKQLLEMFNDTDFDGYPLAWTLIDLFENQVEKAGDNWAVIMKGIFVEGHEQGLTYREFSRKVGAMATHLQSLGVKAETIVGVMVERSIEMMIALYGILKIGAAYLPIEPGNPAHRVQYLLKDSQVSALVTMWKWQKVLKAEVRIDESLPLVFIDEVGPVEWERTGRFSSSLPAYVIYTSGSTGKPKGVMVEHRSAVNRISWMVRQYPLQRNDVVLQKTTYTFDVSIWELFSWSFTGVTLCLLEPGGEKNPPLLAETMERAGVTTMHFVPSMLSVFLDYMEDAGEKWNFDYLRQVFTSGEALGVHHVQRFNRIFNKNRVIQLINLYGPTEATVDVSYFDCPGGEAIDYHTIPIGRPIDNIRLFVLDRELQLLPVGVVGELCIAGIGVARGYLNRPGLTLEKFIELDHSLSQRLGVSSQRKDQGWAYRSLYKTGDLARWLSDGNIEYLGRLDHQVKIRGFRIELGEIETLLARYPGVKEVVVIDRRDEGSEAYLCAYIVPSMPGFDASGHGLALREYLLAYLPEYMIPAFFITLDSLPLTMSGKLNRGSLPRPGQLDLGTGKDYIEPRTALEKLIADTWKEVLRVEKIGIHDMFFTIGGNSLNILQVNRRLVQKLGKAIPVVSMFRFTTISRLAAHLNEDEMEEMKNQETIPDRAETRSKGKERRIMKIKKHREKNK